MVELGSFWAYYSLWFARAMPAARLVLVEPDPAHLAVGRRNFELNGVSGQFVHAALGLPDGARALLECESDGIEREVELVSVDGLIDREDLERIDLLLCDTQGAEAGLLDGARAALAAGRLRFLVVSTHHHTISGDALTHQRCLRALGEAGAHIIAEHTVSESFSGDGLIVASMDPRDSDLRVELSHARARDSLFGEPEADLAAAQAEREDARAERDAARAEGKEALAERDAARAERDVALARAAELAEQLTGASLLRRLRPPRAGRRER
jgi:FkbM family methyltransferase